MLYRTYYFFLATLVLFLIQCSPSSRDYFQNTGRRWPKPLPSKPTIESQPKSYDLSLFWGQWLEIQRRINVIEALRSTSYLNDSTCYQILTPVHGVKTTVSVSWNCQMKLSPFQKEVAIRGSEDYVISYSQNKGWADFIAHGDYAKIEVKLKPLPSSQGNYGMQALWQEAHFPNGIYLQSSDLTLTQESVPPQIAIHLKLNFMQEPQHFKTAGKKESLSVTNYWALSTVANVASDGLQVSQWQTEITHELVRRQSGVKNEIDLWQISAESGTATALDDCGVPEFQDQAFSHIDDKGEKQTGKISFQNLEWSFQLGKNTKSLKHPIKYCNHSLGFIENFVTLLNQAN
ncbi:MAG: hypothetical protein KDD61_08135 [Bdellovibrionales bacterium]|nr:hypothetical protein [Bdellovibrionales bacterium]